MKKILTLTAFTMLFLACKTSSVTSKKVDSTAQVGIKGDWKITSVSYPGSDFLKVNAFEIADAKCFEGSTWKFISNNNKGNMSLSKCTSYSSAFTWFINKEGQFILKLLADGDKARKVRDGYVLSLSNQTENSFELSTPINVGGQNKMLVYKFEKMN